MIHLLIHLTTTQHSERVLICKLPYLKIKNKKYLCKVSVFVFLNDPKCFQQPEKSVVLIKVTICSSRESTAGETSFLFLLDKKTEQSKPATGQKHKQETHSEINQLK